MSRLKAAAMLMILLALLLVSFVTVQPRVAYARANLTAYMTVPPTDWEPFGYNNSSTTPYYIVHTLGWSPVRLMGNVGIGDGRWSTLNESSNQNVDYTANNFMAVDISMAPWDPGRLTSTPSQLEASAVNATAANNTTAANETTANNTTAVNNTTSANSTASAPNTMTFGNITMVMNADRDLVNETAAPASNANETANETANQTAAPATNQTVSDAAGTISFNRPLSDPYHPILMGRPVNDLLYEYPLAVTITAYARLIGLPMPCGSCANIGIRCLGYGY